MLKPRCPVVLASGSPRRRELLREIFADFEVAVPEVDEHAPERANPWELAESLADEKASRVFAARPECLVIGGDTVVALPECEGYGLPRFSEHELKGPAGVEMALLAKPSDPEDAKRILKRLSGRTHLVVTGIALYWPGGRFVFSDTSQVTLRALSDCDIADYVATGEPMDKAGAYGVQGLAKGFVSGVIGSLSNVIGLPTQRLQERLIALEIAGVLA